MLDTTLIALVCLQICLQIVYIFTPVSAAISILAETLFSYIAIAGYTHGSQRAQERQRAAEAGPHGQLAASSALAPELLACAAGALAEGMLGHSESSFQGKPCEYLTPWLPRVMFDHIAALVSIGMGIDEVAKSHNMKALKALDVIKHQVCIRHCLPALRSRPQPP